MAREGGYEWYQSLALYSSTFPLILKFFLKDPGPDAYSGTPHSKIFQANSLKMLKIIPERPVPQLREWRSEAFRDNADWNMGRSAIQFSTPDAP
jgi:hypothetical protein